ncbi:MAG: DUF2851 family protein [Saprospiraceae bacterium]
MRIFIKNSRIDQKSVVGQGFGRKIRRETELLKSTRDHQNDWEESFYIFLARQFGAKINQEPFEQLAKITCPYFTKAP